MSLFDYLRKPGPPHAIEVSPAERARLEAKLETVEASGSPFPPPGLALVESSRVPEGHAFVVDRDGKMIAVLRFSVDNPNEGR